MTEDQPTPPEPPAAANSAPPDRPSPETADPPPQGHSDDKSPAVAPSTAAAPLAAGQKRKIKIGSQRDSDTAAQTLKARPQNVSPTAAAPLPAAEPTPPTTPPSTAPPPVSPAAGSEKPQPPPPRLAARLSPELQQEVDAALSQVNMEELLAGAPPVQQLEEGAPVKAKVLSVREDIVLVDLDRQHQGAISIKQFETLPEPGTVVDAVVSRFVADEGIYELQIVGAAVDVAGWDELAEGMTVEAVVTGHNKGGLECEVHKLRGFIPASQVALYHVENLEEMVGQRFACVVTEVKPEHRNLVLSRRAVLERERTAAKQKLLEELQVGQLREGIVRRLQPFGAFVDLGGVDGLLHVSQLSWDRIGHPREVLQEGQKIQVKISKIHPETGKIGLAYRDTWENPWNKVADKYKPKSTVTGTITRLTDFGAFVKLEPGVEGLIHVSEIAHQRVWRPSDVLSEGQEVEVMVLAVDPDQQRISLSLKALQARPQKQEDQDRRPGGSASGAAEPPESSAPAGRTKTKHQQLRGGTNRPSGGESFGLKW